jgi:hypothetical protein
MSSRRPGRAGSGAASSDRVWVNVSWTVMRMRATLRPHVTAGATLMER